MVEHRDTVSHSSEAPGQGQQFRTRESDTGNEQDTLGRRACRERHGNVGEAFTYANAFFMMSTASASFKK
jgi:hypothetical protein